MTLALIWVPGLQLLWDILLKATCAWFPFISATFHGTESANKKLRVWYSVTGRQDLISATHTPSVSSSRKWQKITISENFCGNPWLERRQSSREFWESLWGTEPWWHLILWAWAEPECRRWNLLWVWPRGRRAFSHSPCSLVCVGVICVLVSCPWLMCHCHCCVCTIWCGNTERSEH